MTKANASESLRDEFGGAVQDNELQYVSVSQLNTFDPVVYGGCERRWHFEKVQRMGGTQTDALSLGSDVHAVIEARLTGDKSVLTERFVGPNKGELLANAMRIIEPGERFIPASGEGLLVEHEFGLVKDLQEAKTIRGVLKQATLPAHEYVREDMNAALVSLSARTLVAGSIPFVGYIDVVNPLGEHLSNEGVTMRDPERTIELLDWKTTSSISSWAKKENELAETIQMISYAEWARRLYPDAKFFRLSHGYFQTSDARKAEKRSVLIPLETVQQKWYRIERVVGRMQQVAHERDAMKVSPNWSACRSYNKECKFAPLCRDKKTLALVRKDDNSGLVRIRTKAGEPMSSMSSRLSALCSTDSALPPDAPASNVKDAAQPLTDEQRAALSPEVRAGIERFERGEKLGTASMGTGLPYVGPEANRVEARKVAGNIGSLLTPLVEPKPVEVAVQVDVGTVLKDIEKTAGACERLSKYAPRETGEEEVLPRLTSGIALYINIHSEQRNVFEDGSAGAGGLRTLSAYFGYVQEKLCKSCEDDCTDVRFSGLQSMTYGRWKAQVREFVKTNPPTPGAYCANFVKDEFEVAVLDAVKSVADVAHTGVVG